MPLRETRVPFEGSRSRLSENKLAGWDDIRCCEVSKRRESLQKGRAVTHFPLSRRTGDSSCSGVAKRLSASFVECFHVAVRPEFLC